VSNYPEAQEVAVEGTVFTSTGLPAANTEVTLTTDGARRTTFADSVGKFKFYGSLGGQATVEASGVAPQEIGLPRSPPAVTLQMQ
jgi:hypothetical protein